MTSLLAKVSPTMFRLRAALIGAITRRSWKTELREVERHHRRAIEESAERYRAIVETAVDAIVVTDRFGTIQSFNRAAGNIFGYSADEMVGESVNRLMHDADGTKHDRHIATYRETGRSKIIGIGRGVIGRRKDGSDVELELSVAEWRDIDRQPCFTGIMRDVSQRNQQARDLQRATEAAEQARVEAESANRAKTNFLAVMSHEIRTPLTSIDGFADLLWHSKDLSRESRRYVELIRAANAALLTIVNDVLDFSKVEAGQIELEAHPFSPSALIQDTMGIVQPVAAKKGLLLKWSIDSRTPDWLIGDVVRLRQILLNLLNNAIKFTDKGSIAVAVRPMLSTDGNELVHFSVTDTGTGIPQQHQYRLFKQFSQADGSISRRYGGTGLGLAICKNLVELMDGQIGVISDIGKGATLWFTAALAAAPVPTPKPRLSHSLEVFSCPRGRILLVDDLETNLEIVQSYLKDGGYDVVSVGGGVEAIRRLQQEQFDLILMDIQMPVVDGVMTTRAIRDLAGPQKNIPIVAMTGNVLPQQVESFIKAGMNDHIGKPIERAKLYSKLWRWLPNRRSDYSPALASSSDFDHAKLDELVGSIGIAKVERTVRKFKETLSDSFKSNLVRSRAEAHDLINAAGVLGFETLVAHLRAVKDCSTDDEEERELMAQCRGTQDTVVQLIDTIVLPQLGSQVLSKIA